jgi:ribonuclease VapC
MSAVNIHEVVKELMRSGLTESVIRDIIAELRLDVCAHDSEAAYASAALLKKERRSSAT